MRFGWIAKGVALVIAIGAIYAYREQVTVVAHQLTRLAAPCSIPITYKLGAIDQKFGISTSTIEKDLATASALWNDAADKQLFVYDQEHGAVTVDFVYDSRQEMTVRLKSLGISVANDRDSYDEIKPQYDAAYARFRAKKTAFDSRLRAFEADTAAYEKLVSYWNARGGAPASEYASLSSQHESLAARSKSLAKEQDALNTLVEEVNDLARALNRLIDILKLDVDKYNATGASNGESFEEGLYERSAGRETITIFEYENNALLTRVLAHELGHALGLDHVEDSSAIMYSLNEGSAIALTEADTAELQAACRIK